MFGKKKTPEQIIEKMRLDPVGRPRSDFELQPKTKPKPTVTCKQFDRLPWK